MWPFDVELNKVMRNDRISRFDRARYYSLVREYYAKVQRSKIEYGLGTVFYFFLWVSQIDMSALTAGTILIFAAGLCDEIIAELKHPRNLPEFKELCSEFDKKYESDWDPNKRKEYSVNELLQKRILK